MSPRSIDYRDEAVREVVGLNVRAILTLLNLSDGWLAAAANMPLKTIQLLIGGGMNLSEERLEAIRSALEVETDDLTTDHHDSVRESRLRVTLIEYGLLKDESHQSAGESGAIEPKQEPSTPAAAEENLEEITTLTEYPKRPTLRRTRFGYWVGKDW